MKDILQHVLSVYFLSKYVVYFCTCTRKMKIIQYAYISSGCDLAIIVLCERQYGAHILSLACAF